MKWLTTGFIVTAAVLTMVPADSNGQVIVFPEEWEGVWEFTTMTYDCDTNALLEELVEEISVCGGDAFIPDIGEPAEFTYTCEGSLTETGMDVTCTMSSELFPGCSVTITSISEAVVSGDTMTGTTTISIDYQGICFVEEERWREEVSAVRLQTDASCSGTSASQHSWGALKDQYR